MQMLDAIHEQLAQGKVARNLIVLFALLGAPMVPTLSQALQQQLTRHERASFRSLLGLSTTREERGIE